MEAVLDKPVGEVFRDRLFTPLGMESTLEGCLLPADRIMPVSRVLPYRGGTGLVLTSLGSVPLRSADPLSHYGHTAGSMCYYDAADRILYAGDTIFFESYGRTDLPTGSDSAMASSLRRLLTSLPPETQVLCGHGPLTTIGHEREVEGIGL